MKGRKEKIDTFKITVDKLVDALGGIDNIESVVHCATRFRVVLKDDSKVDKEKLENVEKSKGYTKEANQWQIIFGAGIVNKVYDKYASLFLPKQQKLSDTANQKIKWNPNYSTKVNIFLFTRHGVRGFAEIFIPLIPLFIAGGLSLAINSLIVALSSKTSDGTLIEPGSIIASKIFDTIGGAILGSLPVLIGYTSAKKWGGNPWFGLAIGLILVAPGLVNSYTLGNANIVWYPLYEKPELQPNQTGIPYLIAWPKTIGVFDINYPLFSIPLMGYQAQVVPTLMVIAVMVWIEKGIRKISHESIAIISVPLVTIVSTIILAFAIIGPLGYVISLAIAKALQGIFIYTNFPGFGIGGALLGGIYPLIVVTGLHQGFLPIEATLIAQIGESWITPIACVSNVSQGIVCLTASMFIKNEKMKGVAYSGGIGANLGITEPAMFGVNINIKHFFIAGMIGSAFGGYWLGMTQTVANSLGSASWLGLIQYDYTFTTNLNNWHTQVINATPWGKYMTGFGIVPGVNAIIAMILASFTAFVFSILLSFSKKGIENLKTINKNQPLSNIIIKLQNKSYILQNNLEKFFLKLFLGTKKYNQIINNKKISYVYAPIDGELIDLNTIEDKTFKNELFGKSFCIKPNNNKYDLYAPFKGLITNIFETGHAITISNKNNNSLLIHIGIQTAQINSNAKNIRNLKCFKFKKFIQSKVNNNSKIVTVDSLDLINNNAKDNKIYFSLLNESVKENQTIKLVANYGTIKKGEPIFEIINN